MSEVTPLWERQKYDKRRSYEAFQLYLNMPHPRSYLGAYRLYVELIKGVEAAEKVTRIGNNFARWCYAKDQLMKPIPDAKTWRERAEAWDNYLREQARLIQLEEIRGRIVKRMNAFDKLLNAGLTIVEKAHLDKLTERNARKLLHTAVKAIGTAANGESSDDSFGDRIVAVMNGDRKYIDDSLTAVSGVPEGGVIQLQWFTPPSMQDETDDDPDNDDNDLLDELED